MRLRRPLTATVLACIAIFTHAATAVALPPTFHPLHFQGRVGQSDSSQQASSAGVEIRPPSLSPNLPFIVTLATNVPLRVMPLGASITYGVSSSDGNGYRSHLRSLLRRNGVAAVNMVGSRRAGTMRDADNEGWPGATVDQVRDHALKSQLDANAEGGDPRRGDGIARWAPNVVLINAGANDCIQNIDIEHVVTTRVRTLLFDAVWRLSPRAAVVLSTLVPLHDGAAESSALRYNADAAALVRELQAAGRRIVLADMRAGPDRLTADDITGDGVHPNDGGYAKMARVWMAAIQDADRRGFLVAPDPVEGLVDNGGDD